MRPGYEEMGRYEEGGVEEEGLIKYRREEMDQILT
jgi:hypothetical protein